jgi:WD40 repeat protein
MRPLTYVYPHTASADDTVQIRSYPTPPPGSRDPPTLTHPVAVRCLLPLALTDLSEPYVITGAGDVIRTYDLSSPTEPELLGVVDAHWHDITGIALWVRKTSGEDGKMRAEPWIVSASLDGTIRKWRLSGA